MLSGTEVRGAWGMRLPKGAGHCMPPAETEGRRQQCHSEACLIRIIFVSSTFSAVERRAVAVPPPHPQNVPELVFTGLWVDPNATGHPREAETLLVRTQKREPRSAGVEFCATIWFCMRLVGFIPGG